MPFDLLNCHIQAISSFHESRVFPRATNDLNGLCWGRAKKQLNLIFINNWPYENYKQNAPTYLLNSLITIVNYRL
ncbi:hypothetical protein BE846_07355 [Legionella pneumophila subsp. pneumophila]|nr:hypothetical protein BE844_09590 [Legionella pneumophila subsp. pneumophila]AOW66803.1 hypothetical protein BE846_07355 [Legionella pneumophila subsp. pneumophila]